MSIRLINGVLLTLAMMTLSCVDDAEIQEPQGPALEDTEFLGRIDAVNRRWNIGDTVLVYDGVSQEAAEYVASRLNTDGDCILKGKVFNTSERYLALYPSSAFEGMSDGNAVYKVSAAQALPHADSSRAATASAAVAMSHLKEFDFVSVVSYLAFDVTADNVEAFTVTAKGGAHLAGTVTISVNDGTMVDSAGEGAVTLASFEGCFKPGRYYVQVKPGTYADGFTVDVDMEAEKTMSFDVDSLDVRAGRIVHAGVISSPVEKPEVTVSQVAFTSAKLSWTRGTKVLEYNIYVNGTKVRTHDGKVRTCKVTGLRTGAENSVEVEAVSALGSEKAEVKIKTAGVYEYEKSTGSSFLCIGWDAPARTEIHGTTQAYQIQVWADEAMTTPVYDFVPEPGGNNTQSQLFGNGSYYGYTQAPQGPDGVKSSNYLTPTRVSVGGFYPNTTYYVRVRTLDSFIQANGTVLSHPFGDSEWSDLIPMSTDPVHVPAGNEIIYAGFNDMCVQTDFINGCLGAKNATSGSSIAWDRRSAQLFYFYVNNHGQHQTNTFGLASNGVRVDGTTNLVADCAILKGNAAGTGNTYIGDMSGWIWAAWTRPVMGAFALDGTGTFIDTPVLASDKLSADGTECTLTFKASLRIRISDEYDPDADALAVKVWRSGTETSAYEQITTFKTSEILPFDVAKDTATEVLNDYGRNTLSCSLTLRPGDVVEIASMRSGYIILDDILVVKK